MAYRKANKPITRKPSANRAKPKSKPKIGRGEMATVGSRKRKPVKLDPRMASASKKSPGRRVAAKAKAKPARRGPVKGTGRSKRR